MHVFHITVTLKIVNYNFRILTRLAKTSLLICIVHSLIKNNNEKKPYVLKTKTKM